MAQLIARSAVVTGASQGIGKSIATAFAQEGIDTVLAARSIEKLEAVRKEIGNTAGEVSCKALDLADLSSVTRFAEALLEERPTLDILVNCGGLYDRRPFSDSSTERLDELYQTNVRGAEALTRSLLPALKVAQGDIVFINSSVVFSPAKDVAHYAATQHALKAIADAIRAEVNADGVRVLNVFPGRTATPLQEKIFKMENREYRPEALLQPADIAEIVVACLKLSQTAEVVELCIRPRNKT